MNQILHIFRKDTRRFWIEILLTVGAIAAFTFLYPSHWKVNHGIDLTLFITVLVPASWLLLIVRVIHAETLVGDSQFWITRPYVWQKLLASKMLFLAVWIAVPYVAAQFTLIAQAGFHPQSYVSVVLFDLLLPTGLLLLPIAALATITANFARMTLTLLGGIVAVVVLAFAASYAVLHGYSAWNPLQDRISLPLELAGAMLIVAVQYATRRVWLARALSVGLILALFFLACFYRSQALIDGAYAGTVDTGAPPIRVALNPAFHPSSSLADTGVRLILPVAYDGVQENRAVVIENVRFSLTAANGATWTSPWNQHPNALRSNPESDLLELDMSTAIFDRFQYGPVTLRVTFAVAIGEADKSETLPYPTAPTWIPGLGICSSNEGHSFLACRAVVNRTARWTYVSDVGSYNGDCELGHPKAGSPRGTWAGSFQPSFGDVNISPVEMSFIRPNGWSTEPTPGGKQWNFCPNSPLIVTEYRPTGRTTLDFTLPNFTLPPVGVANPSK